MRSVRAQREIALVMMQSVERIIHLVVVKQRELVMNLGAPRAVIEGSFVKIDRSHKISLGRFPVRVFDELGMARCHHSIAAGEQEHEQDRQSKRKLVSQPHPRQPSYS